MKMFCTSNWSQDLKVSHRSACKLPSSLFRTLETQLPADMRIRTLIGRLSQMDVSFMVSGAGQMMKLQT